MHYVTMIRMPLMHALSHGTRMRRYNNKYLTYSGPTSFFDFYSESRPKPNHGCTRRAPLITHTVMAPCKVLVDALRPALMDALSVHCACEYHTYSGPTFFMSSWRRVALVDGVFMSHADAENHHEQLCYQPWPVNNHLDHCVADSNIYEDLVKFGPCGHRCPGTCVRDRVHRAWPLPASSDR